MKYKLTDNTIEYDNKTLYQIEAVKDFSYIKTGDLGGWIEYKGNLNQEGNCWVDDNAMVYDNAKVYGDAAVWGNTEVYGNAQVCGEARVYGNAQVCGYTQVEGNAYICANNIFSKGHFIGGCDQNGITEITDKTGSDYWNHQYVLGEYKIEPLNNEKNKLLEKADELIKRAKEPKEEADKL